MLKREQSYAMRRRVRAHAPVGGDGSLRVKILQPASKPAPARAIWVGFVRIRPAFKVAIRRVVLRPAGHDLQEALMLVAHGQRMTTRGGPMQAVVDAKPGRAAA